MVVALSILTAASDWFNLPIALRVVVGIPFVLLLPGYSIVSFLFPGRSALDGVERAALAFGLSLAAVAPLALAIDASPWRLGTIAILWTVSLTNFTFVAGAVYRRRRLDPDERFALPLSSVSFSLRRWSRGDRAVGATVLAVAILLAVSGLYIIRSDVRTDPMTEFALYNEAGEPAYFPRDIEVGQTVDVRVSVTNLEGSDVTYAIQVTGAAIAADSFPLIVLENGQTWTGPVRFTVTEPGEQLTVRFELWRNDPPQPGGEPYRSLHLMVDARQPAQVASHG